MKIVPHLVRLVLACISVTLSASLVAADGVHIPDAAIATMPGIPVQRAMVLWRDGVETLVVESAFTTASPTVGWVLPLPAEPETLAQADPGILTSLEMTLGPDLSDSFGDLRWILPWVLAFIAPLCLIVMVSKNRRAATLPMLLWILCFVLILGLFAPTLSQGTTEDFFQEADADGIDVSQIQRVDDYEMAVLRATSGAALTDWLAANKLKQLDAAGQQIVDEYIARKWCFVVARLAGAGDRTGVPHPIAATFRADRPVYPMKLTALADSTTRVDLFVAADVQMAAPGFETILADRFTRRAYAIEDLDRPQPWFDSGHGPITIGNPDAVALLGGPCIVTHLRADLSPEDMDRDIELTPVEFDRQRAHHLTTQSRRSLILVMLTLGGITLAVGCLPLFAYRRRPKGWQVRLLAGLILALLVTVAVIHFLVPATPVRTMRLPLYSTYRLELGGLNHFVASLAVDGKIHREMTGEKIIQALKREEYVPEYFIKVNPLTGQPIKDERTPGNYSIRHEGDRTFFCLYDRNGREYRTELKPPRE